jgi:formylglycine-generating enzyme required for sulfatase activity
MPPTSHRPVPVLLILLLLAACSAEPGPAGRIVTSTLPPTRTPEPASPTATPTLTPLPTTTSVPSATPAPERFVDESGQVMQYVPAGEFIMGSEAGFPDEMPVHAVYLDAFYIDRLETTNRQYQDCVEAGACRPPRRTDCCTEDPNYYVRWPEYFGNPEFDDYPVIFVSWFDARDYCAWRGARLATEAEWEKAARGPDGRTYPWGNEEPTPDRLNFTWPESAFSQRPLYRTAPVGSFPAGASPYGVLDMAGNVYEWVYDIYERDYYEHSPYMNPTGPEEGTFRVTRGGSFYNQAFRNRSSNRNNAYIPADSFHFDGGIRCARDAE